MVARGERLTGVPGKGQQALVPSFIGGDQTLTGKTRNLRDLAGLSKSFFSDPMLCGVQVTYLKVVLRNLAEPACLRLTY